jgi:hypothetical protein
MEAKTLTNRILLGEYPLYASVEDFRDQQLVFTLAKQSEIHVALVKEKQSQVLQFITSLRPIVINTEFFEVLYNV